MTQSLQEEQYVHLYQCLADMGDAWRVLTAIEEEGAASRLSFPAFKYAVIAYCRPFRRSFGLAKSWHVLEADFLLPEHLPLHQEALDLRDWILAHSDLTAAEAEVYVSNTPAGKIAGFVRNAERGESLWTKRKSFLALIEFALEALEPRLKEAEAALPVTRDLTIER